jgi:hypothetical protein
MGASISQPCVGEKMDLGMAQKNGKTLFFSGPAFWINVDRNKSV